MRANIKTGIDTGSTAITWHRSSSQEKAAGNRKPRSLFTAQVLFDQGVDGSDVSDRVERGS
jgi:hypothetical protein